MPKSIPRVMAITPRRKRFYLRSLFVVIALLHCFAAGHAQDQRCNRAVARGVIDVSGYFTPNDRFQHAIVSNDGSLFEIFFDPAKGIFQSHLGRFSETVAIAAEYTAVDLQRQSVIVARENGEVHQLWFIPSRRIESRLLNRYSSVIDVAAFNDDVIQRAVILNSNGNIVEIEWTSTGSLEPGPVVSEKVLTNIPGATRVAGFFARDDGSNIVIVATRTGEVHEIFYKDPTRISQSVIANFPNIIDVGAFYTHDDKFRHAIVATSSGEIHDVFYHPLKGKGSTPLITVPGLKNISAYTTSPVDGWRHVIVSTTAGEVKEFFYDPKIGKGIGPLRSYSPESPIGEDPSPDLANGKPQSFRASTAGLTMAVAGDENVRYSVSLNAGVWKTGEGGQWQQLPKSPPLALSIAVDPVNVLHLLVGERNGDAVAANLNRSGIWESFDGGNSWSYEFDPRTIGCFWQSIPAVAFDAKSNMYAATDCGIVKKPSGGPAFQVLSGTTGKGPFTSVTTVEVAGQTWLWARTANDFFVSRDAGVTWDQSAIPSVVSGKSIRWGSRGDHFSLAAFDTSAFTIVTGPASTGIISYEANSKTWSLEDVRDGDGTGLGGRRFVKSFFLNGPSLHWVLFAGTGQGVFMKVVGSPIVWKRIAETPWPLGPGDKHEFNPVSDIHADIWDLHVAVAGSVNSIWLATDGGVYRTSLDQALSSLPGVSPAYEHQNEGLHTHHAHTISLINEGMTMRPKIVYSTADNDEWLRNSSPTLYPIEPWRTWGQQGDSNWTAADYGGSKIALIMRNPDLLHLTGFGAAVPFAADKYARNPRAFKITTGSFFRGQEFFNFIQPRQYDTIAPLMDIVMLAKLPLATPDPTGKTVLIRNRMFAANPNADDSKLSTPDWTIEDNNLPDGAQRVWSSDGHPQPVFYIYTENGPATDRRLFRRNGPGQPWKDITPPAPLLPYPSSGSGSTLFGPAFVNPYNPNHLLVSTVRGIMVSHNAGASYTDDSVLTALITASGKFPLNGFYRGGNGANVVHFSQGPLMATLSQVVFFRDDPQKLVVAAPYTGVFYLNGACGYWQDLTPYLPTPTPAVPSLAIDHEAVYAALEGRSIYRIKGYEYAPRATFFSRDGLATRQVAVLMRAGGGPIAGTPVTLTLLKNDGTVLFRGPVTTDGMGIINFPPIVTLPGNYIIHLDYAGALPLLAPSTTSFPFTL